jgi:tetratricopeptide (TPR) repeat protein
MLDEIIGTCHAFQHDTEGALRELATRQAALREGGQAHTVAMAGSLVDLGDVERDRKRYAEARTAYLSALAMYESIVGPADARLALPLTHLGEVELALKHTAAAVTALERALALYEAAGTAALSLADAQFPLARAVWPAPRAIDLATAARDALRAAGPQFASRADEVVAWLASHPRR